MAAQLPDGFGDAIGVGLANLDPAALHLLRDGCHRRLHGVGLLGRLFRLHGFHVLPTLAEEDDDVCKWEQHLEVAVGFLVRLELV